MGESTLSIKGQTTVPQHIRDSLNAAAGTKLNWHVMPDGTVIVRAKTKSINDLGGVLKTSIKKSNRKLVAIDDMNRWR
jgi:antitoxin PrlF